MIRLWLAWLRTRLAGQHRLTWWEVQYELRCAIQRDQVTRAIMSHLTPEEPHE